MTPYTKAKTLRPPSAAWKQMVAARLREDGTLAKWWPKTSEAAQ